jgi:hypothetical protein
VIMLDLVLGGISKRNYRGGTLKYPGVEVVYTSCDAKHCQFVYIHLGRIVVIFVLRRVPRPPHREGFFAKNPDLTLLGIQPANFIFTGTKSINSEIFGFFGIKVRIYFTYKL